MQQFLPLFLVFVIFLGVLGFMTYRTNTQRRVREKKRNQYLDRV